MTGGQDHHSLMHEALAEARSHITKAQGGEAAAPRIASALRALERADGHEHAWRDELAATAALKAERAAKARSRDG
jgi:hypothetical protein